MRPLRDGLVNGFGAAVAAVFAYVTASLIPFFHEAYWAPIAAVVVMYPELSATRKAGADRFIGTFIGCAVGGVAALVSQRNVAIYGAAILVGVALCYVVRLSAASRLCAVAITVVVLVPHPEPGVQVALYRFVEVSYGVGCALVYTMIAERLERVRSARVGDKG